MKLSGKQFEVLSQALLNAFDHGSLTRMVRIELDEDLGHIASPGSLTQVVDELIRWSERNNKVQALIEGACRQNPGNVLLQNLKLSAESERWFQITDLSEGNTGVRSQISQIKRKALEDRLSLLGQEYNAASNQMSTTLDAVFKVKLRRQLDSLEQEMKTVETELDQLG